MHCWNIESTLKHPKPKTYPPTWSGCLPHTKEVHATIIKNNLRPYTSVCIHTYRIYDDISHHSSNGREYCDQFSTQQAPSFCKNCGCSLLPPPMCHPNLLFGQPPSPPPATTTTKQQGKLNRKQGTHIHMFHICMQHVRYTHKHGEWRVTEVSNNCVVVVIQCITSCNDLAGLFYIAPGYILCLEKGMNRLVNWWLLNGYGSKCSCRSRST